MIRTEETLEGKWITVSRGENDARFLVLPLTLKANQKLLNKHSQKRKGFRDQEFDNFKFLCDKFDQTVQDWDELGDSKGSPLECNRKNKEFMVNRYLSIVNEVIDAAEEYGEAVDEEKEDERKNSRTSQRAKSIPKAGTDSLAKSA